MRTLPAPDGTARGVLDVDEVRGLPSPGEYLAGIRFEVRSTPIYDEVLERAFEDALAVDSPDQTE